MLLVFQASWNVHVSGVFSWTNVFRFNPTNEKSAFIELTSFISFDNEVAISTLDIGHHLLINLSCISASKPHIAHYCTWASHRGRHHDCACYTVFTRLWCVHQHSTFNRSREATLLWGTDFQRRPSTKLSRI